MTTAQILQLAFYGALAGSALWATWTPRDLFWIGFWLMGGYLVSNAMWLAGAAPGSRPGPYTLIEMMVALASYCAWEEYRERAFIAILVANLTSICCNIALAINNPATARQIYLHEVTTNICFAVECLIAIVMGVRHGYRSGRFFWWPHFRRRSTEPRATRKDGPR